MCLNELAQVGDAFISCYIHEIPSFIETKLVKAYAALHSSLPFFKVFRSIDHASCYVAERKDHPSTVLVFKIRNRQVEVLNEMIEIEPQEIRRFAYYIFGRFDKVDIINFKALQTTADHFGFPVQRYNSKDTYVITLPGTPQEYADSLGKSTRAYIRKKMNRVLLDFPSFTSRFFINEEIDEDLVRKIIKFSENKINANGVKLSHDVEQILALVKMCGFVSVLLINGRVCAGWISYQIDSNYFGAVTGYDPQYEKHGVGNICMHLTICESILRGGAKYDLGGGMFEYKHRMLAKTCSMDALNIYRSYSKMLVNFDTVAKSAAAGYVGLLKKVLHKNKQKPWAKCVFDCFYFFRNKLAK
jgi:hypothetical protein